MVNLIIGRCGSGKSTLVCDAVVKEIREGKRQIVLIVPEQQTVVWETKMANLLPPSSNFRLEITNFTRLANSVFREVGGLADTIVDEGTRSLLIWRAMLSVWDQLTVYNHCKSGREDRNIPHVMAAVDELKNSGITPENAEKALNALRAEEVERDGEKRTEKQTEAVGDLSSRLSDAVLVYAAYNEFLHKDYIDRGDLLDNLAKTLAQHDYFKNKVIFIDSFFSLTSAEERILAQMMRQADEVTLTFACPPRDAAAGKYEQETEGGQISMLAEEDVAQPEIEEIQFREIRRYLRTATALAYRAGQDVKRIELRENLRHREAAELRMIERYLFDYVQDIPTFEQEDAGECAVQIIRCADVYDEAQACASIVDKLLREGYQCSDIAVVARNMKSREGIVDTVLRQHGVRCFLSETSDVANLPAVRFILAALSVAAGGWQRKDMIRLLKTGLTLVGRESAAVTEHYEDAADNVQDIPGSTVKINTSLEGDIFELYTETWNIHGRKMYLSAWSMNPAGYKIERNEVGEEMLRLANAAREKLVEPLDAFLSVFENGAAGVREIVERIVQYAEDCRIGESLCGIAESYRKLGMYADAEKALASWDKVCDILECMVENLGDTELDAGRFAGLFARVASSMDVGTIPTGVDEVVLGSSSGVRMEQVKCVIMLGAVEGEFPGSVTDSGTFFSERDKEALEAVGLNIGSPDLAERSAREYFMFYRTAAAAGERLYVLTPSVEDKNLSEGALRMKAILEKLYADERVYNKKFAEMPLHEVIYHANTAEYLLCRRVKPEDTAILRFVAEHKVQDAVFALSAAKETVENAQILLMGEEQELASVRDNRPNKRFVAGRMTLSQSKIESFVQCPFQYWCRYQMKLRPTAKAEIKAPDIGTFMHAVLERFFTSLPVEKLNAMPLSRTETERIADEIMGNYIDSLAASGLGQKAENGKIVLDGRLQYLFLRLRRHVLVFLEALMQELSQSEFRPAAFELPIGISGVQEGVKPIVIRTESGVEITLQGIADRIDVYDAPDGKQYVRVVDYKTGSKTFSLEDVKRGLNVQMLIYLFSVWRYGMPMTAKDKEIVPAGAVYFQAKPVSISAESIPDEDTARKAAMEKIERTGVLLRDEEVLRAMEKELGGKFIKTKLDASGRLKEMQKSTSLLSLEEFGSLAKELEDVIGKIGTRILSGEADAAPMRIGGKSPCDWCENRYICRIQRS